MTLRTAIYKLAWDTRCRSVDVRRVLGQFGGASVLDAGCGEFGLAAFMPGVNITGVDILPPERVDPRLNYEYGSITELPFEDRSFDVAVSVDVLEHLATEMREPAVAELVRVARRAVVIAFPSGRTAREIDEDFGGKLKAAGRQLPDWLEEHLAQDYPDTDTVITRIEKAALNDARSAAISTVYSEHLSVAKFLRSWALRSKYGYLTANLAAGALSPLMPRTTAETAYRSIVLAEFSDA